MLPPAVPYKMKSRKYGEQGSTTVLHTKRRAGESLPTKNGLEIANKYDNPLYTEPWGVSVYRAAVYLACGEFDKVKMESL